MKRAYVTYLGTDRFLYGVLALNQSLKENSNGYDLIVMVGPRVSSQVIGFLQEKSLLYKVVDDIGNPNKEVENDRRGVKFMYGKLRVFELFEYDKILYIDADMVVCSDIQCLFDKPHMSAVVAGHLARRDWKDFNAGLMVIEPEPAVFTRMMELVAVLPSEDGTDQGFLKSYYPNWRRDKDLHLEHKFNVPADMMEHYCKSHDFEFTYNGKDLHTKNVSVIHYWGPGKPWDHNLEEMKQLETKTKYQQSIILWWDYFYRAM